EQVRQRRVDRGVHLGRRLAGLQLLVQEVQGDPGELPVARLVVLGLRGVLEAVVEVDDHRVRIVEVQRRSLNPSDGRARLYWSAFMLVPANPLFRPLRDRTTCTHDPSRGSISGLGVYVGLFRAVSCGFDLWSAWKPVHNRAAA